MSAKKTFYDDGQHSLDRYSDDFVSDDENRTQKQKRVPTPRKNVGHQYYQDKFVWRGSGSLRGQGRGIRKGRGSGRGNSRASEPADMKKHNDSITRVMSASRNRINELRNKIEELTIKTRNLEQENKLFKSLQFRHEKTIRGFEDKENDLPTILDKHNNEIRTLKEQNRRLREKYEKSDRYLRDAEDQLEKVKRKMNKYKEMCENKELMERDELSRKLAKIEQEMEEKEVKIKELQKHIEVLRKSHKHEVGAEAGKQKEIRKQLEELKEKNSQLEILLKDKCRAMGYQNIHSNQRQGRSSRNNSPDGSLQSKRRTSSMTELTPRDRAKFYAEKQLADLHKHKLKEDLEGKKNLREEKKKIDSPKSTPDSSISGANVILGGTKENIGWNKDEIAEHDKEHIRRGDKEWIHRQTIKQRKQYEQYIASIVTKDQEIEKKKENDKLQEQETRDRKERQVSEKKQQDLKDKKKSREERRQQLKKDDLERESLLQAKIKKKDEVSNQLTAMDEIDGKVLDSSSHLSSLTATINQSNGFEGNNDFSLTKSVSTMQHTKSPYTEVTSIVDHPMQPNTDITSTVHRSKPQHVDDMSSQLDHQKNKRQSSVDDTEGYKPSYGPTRASINKPIQKLPSSFDDDEPVFKIINNNSLTTRTRQADKKTNLLESLFGPQANSSNNPSAKKLEENEPFLIMDKSPSLNGQATSVTTSNFPWETNSGLTKTNRSTIDPEKKQIIFGGNPTWIDGDVFSSNKLPSYQHRQQNHKFPAENSITTLDNFGDDIEEVVL